MPETSGRKKAFVNTSNPPHIMTDATRFIEYHNPEAASLLVIRREKCENESFISRTDLPKTQICITALTATEASIAIPTLVREASEKASNSARSRAFTATAVNC